MSLLDRIGSVIGGVRRQGGRHAAGHDFTRARVHHEEMPKHFYAIGDVHGCLNLVCRLEDMIGAELSAHKGSATILYLGDLIDRGPNSAGVIDHLLKPAPAGITREFVAGNHEQAMLDFLDGADNGGDWLRFGGLETLMSYGVRGETLSSWRARPGKLRQSAASHIPEEHLTFLRQLPVLHEYPGYLFVHAGVLAGKPIESQSDIELMWIRNGRMGAEGRTVVHGHTPVSAPLVSPAEVNVDTCAYATGRLTALRLDDGKFHGTISV